MFGQIGSNPPPVIAGDKRETVYSHVDFCVANAHSVNGLPQKKGVIPFCSQNYIEIQDHCHGVYLPPSIKGEEISFRDIHNFSFSAKIQDDIFPLGTEYCCTTLWVKNSLEIALSVTISKIFSMFIFC